MRIAICGGTGDIGEGLALRWAADTDHDVLIGSRDPAKARAKAEEYENELDSRGIERSIGGFANGMVAERGDVVVVAVPPYHVADTVESIADRLEEGTILVTPAVGLTRDETGAHYRPPSAGSVTQLVASAAPPGVPVVGAFHTLPAGRLADLDATLGIDTLVIGDDEDAVDIVSRLAAEIDGLRPLYAGPLANAAEVESVTPLLIDLAIHEEQLHDLGVRFV